MWCDLEHRWRIVSGLGGSRLQGLDMAQAESVMRLSGIKKRQRRQIYADLRLMEEAALEEICA